MPGHGSLVSCVLLVFLPHLLQKPPHARAQSGSPDVDDEPDLPRITCFSILANSPQDDRITCELAEPITDSEPFNVTFSEDQVTESCEINPRVTRSCSVAISKFALVNHCCIRVSKMDSPERSLCVHDKKIIHMVKPGPPYRVNVTVLMDAEEIELLWATPSVRFQQLTKNLLHQISYRSPDSEWQLLNVTVCSVRLLMKHLIPNSKYMVRIRSIPDHQYFKGIWSDWSQTVNFKTPSSGSTLSTGVKLTISLLILVFIFLFGLSALFWENRIKPHIWPKVPNPKCALERIYMKPGKVGEVSFNPYVFLDVMVSRVDMIQIKGAQMCHRNLSAVCEAAEGNSNMERELLLSAHPTVERAGNIRTSIPQSAAHTPEPHKAVEPERGARLCKGASGPPSCLSRGIQLRGRAGTHCNSLGPLPGDIPHGGAACVEESAQVTERPGIRSSNQGSNFPGSPVAPPDESYITMSNLYKIQ